MARYFVVADHSGLQWLISLKEPTGGWLVGHAIYNNLRSMSFIEKASIMQTLVFDVPN